MAKLKPSSPAMKLALAKALRQGAVRHDDRHQLKMAEELEEIARKEMQEKLPLPEPVPEPARSSVGIDWDLHREAENRARKRCPPPRFHPAAYGIGGAGLCGFVLDILDTRAAFDAWLMLEGMAIGFAIPAGLAWMQWREYHKRVEWEYDGLILQKIP